MRVQRTFEIEWAVTSETYGYGPSHPPASSFASLDDALDEAKRRLLESETESGYVSPVRISRMERQVEVSQA